MEAEPKRKKNKKVYFVVGPNGRLSGPISPLSESVFNRVSLLSHTCNLLEQLRITADPQETYDWNCYFEDFVNSNPNIDFLYERIVQS